MSAADTGTNMDPEEIRRGRRRLPALGEALKNLAFQSCIHRGTGMFPRGFQSYLKRQAGERKRKRNPPMLIYLHGFNSSPSSHKVQVLAEHLRTLGRAADWVCPALPHEPDRAVVAIEGNIVHPHQITLVRHNGTLVVLVAHTPNFRAVRRRNTTDLSGPRTLRPALDRHRVR